MWTDYVLFLLPLSADQSVKGDCQQYSHTVCTTCESLVMHRKDDDVKMVVGPLDKIFGKMMYLKEQILALMPRFEELLGECREGIKLDEDALRILYMETSAARDTLVLQFLHLEGTIKNLKLTEHSPEYENLLRVNIYKAMQLFLQKNLLKLQLLPSFEELKKQRKELHEPILSSQSDDNAGVKRALIKQI